MACSGAAYDRQRGWWALARDSYLGGAWYASPSSATLGSAQLRGWSQSEDESGKVSVVEASWGTARSYLVPFAGESPSSFKARHARAVHVPIVQPIVDAYCDAVTGRVDRNLGTLAAYLKSVDGRGGEWADVVDDVARSAALYGFCAVVVDAPRENPARSLAEEQALGIGARVIVVPPAALAWVTVDDEGELEELAYVDQPYEADALAGNTRSTVRLWLWTRTEWKTISAEVSTGEGLSTQRDGVLRDGKELDGGPLPASLQGAVPVRWAFFRRLTDSRFPLGASLVADAVDLERAAYNGLATLYDMMAKTSFSFLALPTKSAGGALEPELELRLGPDAPLPYSSETGAPQWVENEGRAVEQYRAQVGWDIAMAFRTVGMEVSTEGGGTQSGTALMVRSRDFEARCSRFARGLERWERSTLDLVAKMLGRTGTPALPLYSLTYPRRFVLEDSQESLARAMLVYQSMADAVGPLGSEALIRQAMAAATSLSEEQVAAVMDDVRKRQSAGASATGEVFAYHLDAGVVTVDEVRAKLGLGPIPGGDAPVAEWTARLKAEAEAAAQPAPVRPVPRTEEPQHTGPDEGRSAA